MLDAIYDKISGFLTALQSPIVQVEEGRRRKVVAVRNGYSIHAVDERPPVHDHTLVGLDDVVAYTHRFGMPTFSSVYVFIRGIRVILNDKDPNDESFGRGEASMALLPSEAALAWGIFDKSGVKSLHQQFADFVEEREADLVERTLVQAVARFEARSSLKYDADLTDGKQIGFVIERGKQTSTIKVPKAFQVEIQLFKGVENKCPIDFRLTFDGPDEEGKVTFRARPQRVDERVETALDDVVTGLKTGLGPEWHVLMGVPSFVKR